MRKGAGQAELDVSARDASGAPLAGLIAKARLAHPVDSRLDHDIPIGLAVGGNFHGSAEAQPGQWELIVDLYHGDERMFRSRSRVSLR